MKTRRYKKRRSFIKKGKRRIRKAKSKYRRRKSRTRKFTRKRKGGLSGLGIGLISLAGVGVGAAGYFGSKHISSQLKKGREIRESIARDRAAQPDWMEWDDDGNVITDIKHRKKLNPEDILADEPSEQNLDHLTQKERDDLKYWQAVDKFSDNNRPVSYLPR